uniref:Uncharacterized protein n=2 Tax=Acrobeloides nanus TaxID=290746 RepID=A0A914DPK3_9BILA
MSASPTILTHRVIVLDEANNQNRHVEVKMEDGFSTNFPIDNINASSPFDYNSGLSRNSNNFGTERFIRVRGEDGIAKYIRATPLGLVNSNQQKPQRANSTSTIRLVPVRTNYTKQYGSDTLRTKSSSEVDPQLAYNEPIRTMADNFSAASQPLTNTRTTSDFGLISSAISSNTFPKNGYSYLTKSYNSPRSIRPSGWNITSNNFSRPGTSFLRGTAQPLSNSLSSYRYQPTTNRSFANYRHVFPRGNRNTAFNSYINNSYGARRNGRNMGYLNFDESEERAISEAIAREEELMRMEEELRRNGSKVDIDLDYQRIEEEILRREAVARQELEQKRLSSLTNYHSSFSSSRRNQTNLDRMTQTKIKEYLSKPTNLEPRMADTEDEKDCRSILNSMVQQVSQWDKQYGWHKTILRKLRDKRVTFQTESSAPPNNIGFRKVPRSSEALLNDHMERLKKEIIKRRLNLLKEAETELEIEFPPAPKQRRKRVPRVANENSAPKQNSDENLDAAIFTLKEEVIENILATTLDDGKQNPLDLFADLITQMQPFDDVLMMDFQPQIENAKSPKFDMKESNNNSYQSPQQQPAEKIDVKVEVPKVEKPRIRTKEPKVATKPKNESLEEAQKRTTKRARKSKDIFEECPVPAKRGRPSKAKSVESSTTGTEPALSPKSTEIDPNKQHCFCNKSYDPKKFYVSCDSCNSWFHGKCIGITKKKARQMESWTCDECGKKESASKELLYCLCKQPYDEKRFYVGCDKCEDWYHPECVGTTQKAVEIAKAAEYICPPCRIKQRIADERPLSKTQQRPPSSLSIIDPLSILPVQPLNREDYLLLWRMWEMLQLHPQSWPFREQIDMKKYPNYTKVIQKPLDLTVLRAKLEKREYKMVKDFASDVCLMLENSRAYHRKYNKNPEILKCADGLENYFYENLANIRDEMRDKAARRVSECLTYASSLDIDPEQLIGFGSDACIDPSILQKLL